MPHGCAEVFGVAAAAAPNRPGGVHPRRRDARESRQAAGTGAPTGPWPTYAGSATAPAASMPYGERS